MTPAENHRYNRFKRQMKQVDCNTESEIRYFLSLLRVWWRWAQHYAFFAVGLIMFIFTLALEVDARLDHSDMVTVFTTSLTAFWLGMGILGMAAPFAYGRKLRELDEFGTRLIAELATKWPLTRLKKRLDASPSQALALWPAQSGREGQGLKIWCYWQTIICLRLAFQDWFRCSPNFLQMKIQEAWRGLFWMNLLAVWVRSFFPSQEGGCGFSESYT